MRILNFSVGIGTLIIVGASVVVGLIVLTLIYRRIPKRLKSEYFLARWNELKAYLRDKKTWPEALIEADKLLDKALRRRKYRGKSMGERLVAAQRTFTDNDGVWFAHNLSKKILADSSVRLKEADVKEALICFRQALRDIGALPNGEARDS